MKALMYILVIICFMDTFVQLPVVGPYALHLGASSLGAGLAIGMYSLTNMLGNIAAGRWIDRYGGKRVLLIGFILTSAILLLYSQVTNDTQLIAVRFLHGLAGGLLVPSVFTLISRHVPNERQGKSMALSGAAVGLAAIIGPATGGIMKAKLGFEAPFLTVAALLALGVILTIFIPRTEGGRSNRGKSSAERTDSQPSRLQPESSLRTLFSMRPVVQSYIAAFALMFGMGSLTFALPIKTDALEFGGQASGMMLSTFGVVAIMVFMLPTNRLFDRVAPLKLIMLGGGIVIASLLTLSLTTDQTMMYITMGVYGLGYALLFPSMNTLLIRHVSEADKGKAFGMFYAFFSLGVVGGSSGIGYLTSSYDTGLRIAGCVLAGLLIIIVVVGKVQIKVSERI
ncbi:MFS transporter [Paenibacillus sp. SC116]|uniref:MFS transporter n=1 Tax=Paenibacillus sp. SC116 TaxID=2968986 RepID=UPI00215A6C5F|nr:MFS transporter [Paenibacillus sp. SC116]MCR8844641.1 MFS transporter [Paenibacillus sp. SC116]